MEQTYFRKGFGLKSEVRPIIDAEYHSALVERIRSRGYTETFGHVTVRLAQEFGFCYGVDRAIDYAYETVRKFPDRRTFLVGEIIHNPHVNQRMRELGIEFIYPDTAGAFDFGHVTPEDVVILPAFGVTLEDFETLKGIGCVLVDTTCGSVLVVWKRVEQYARDGFTAVIHGKHKHEESRATASQVHKYAQGKYVIVRDMDEVEILCDYVLERPGAPSREAFQTHFLGKASPDFDPDTDLLKVGMANQTTMLAGESLMIGARLRVAMAERHGEAYAAANFRAFDTLCSATQERQDAVAEMMKDPPDLMIVVGGYNSSNTNHLAHLCRGHTTTYHIDNATKIDVETGVLSHKPELDAHAAEVQEDRWLPSGPFSLGITAGASTPNNKVGEALVRVLAILGLEPDLAALEGPASAVGGP
ncbi:MAG TPA: 4-hydroxy-3-methylbut-2-enyl diphosphate reductase [Longimicrobiales bacterium]|jgi:4-hydroxy-3-methylbut-2-enyl diphosphate reductase